MIRRRRKPAKGPIVIGLTGSIGMGKSTVARQFERLGAARCDSDSIVHRLLAPGGAAAPGVAALFPGALQDGRIARHKIAEAVAEMPEYLPRLEALLHPLVRAAQRAAILRAQKRGKRCIVLDIPLLFETGAERRCDIVMTADAPAFLQRQRVLARPFMSEARLAAILTRQWPNARKRRLSDFVIKTGLGKRASLLQARRILSKIMR